MKDFLSSQPQIKMVYDPNVPTPRLQMYREGKDEADETIFIAHIPSGMVKNLLKEKKLLAKGYDEL